LDAEPDLLRLVHQFDLDALAEVYDRYSPGVYRYALRLLGETDLAEDCVAETFSRFLQALRAGRGPETYLQAYLYRVAHNWITDHYRRRPPPPLALDPDLHADTSSADPQLTVADQLQREHVRAALARLTPEQRQVISLKYLEGWENDAIAAALQKPVGAVKALQHRAIASLKRLLLPVEEQQHAS
jgi:RNA polymerase sigma-70 factor (ECF subfamily)